MGARRTRVKNPLAKRLKEARQLRGLSQRDLGIRAGIDPSAASPRINQYERGKHAPNFTVAARLAEVLGLPTAYLYAEDDELAVLIMKFGAASPSARVAMRRAAGE